VISYTPISRPSRELHEEVRSLDGRNRNVVPWCQALTHLGRACGFRGRRCSGDGRADETSSPVRGSRRCGQDGACQRIAVDGRGDEEAGNAGDVSRDCQRRPLRRCGSEPPGGIPIFRVAHKAKKLRRLPSRLTFLPRASCFCLRRWLLPHDDCVDDVDHTVRLIHVRDRDLRRHSLFVLQRPAVDHQPQLAAAHRRELDDAVLRLLHQ